MPCTKERPLSGHARIRYISPIVFLMCCFTRLAAQQQAERIPVYDVRVIAKDNLDSAVRILTRMVQRSEQQQDYNQAFEAYIALAATYLHKNDYRPAAHAYQYALMYSVKTSAPHQSICRALNGAGYMWLIRGDYRQAAQFLFTAVQIGERYIWEDSRVADPLAGVYSNLSSALTELKEYDKALYYLNKAEAMAIRMQGHLRLANIWQNMAIVYNKTGKREAAWKYGEQALKQARSCTYYHAEYAALQTLATILLDDHQPVKAIPYLEATLQIKGNSNASYAARTFYLLGTAYQATGDLKLAAYYFARTLMKAEESKSSGVELQAQIQLAELHSMRRDYPNAFLHLQHAYRLRDSLLQQDKTAAVHQLEIKYHSAQKDYDIAQNRLLLQEQQRRLQRKNIWIGGVAGGSLAMAILLFALYRSYKHKSRLRVKQLEIDGLKATIRGEEQERARIARELHDGIAGMITAVKMNFTGVRNIYPFLKDTAGFSDAMDLLEETATELRYTAYNLTPEILTQHELPDAIALFCQQVHKSSRLEISFLAYGSFDCLENEFKLSVYRIVQELINNVIKHAQATHAIVQLSRYDHTFSLTVEDNGIGAELAGGTRGGLGLYHLETRVKGLRGRITIDTAAESGTTVYVEFNLADTHSTHTDKQTL